MTASPRQPFSIEPSMVKGGAGSILLVHYAPSNHSATTGVLILPPFMEEMNRSRRMAALQAQELARSGRGAVVVDLYGCGDSAGEFRDARWEIWMEDAVRSIAWMRERGYREIALLGVRAGALLALQAAGSLCQEIARIVLWQPVLNGEQVITQFLRLRIAGELAGGANRTGTAELRRTLASDGAMEIAGYELHHDLATAMEKLKLVELGLACMAPVDWIEVVPQEDRPSPPVHAQVAKRWREAGTALTQHRVVGEPFWSLQETTIAAGVISKTSEILGGQR